MQRKLKMNTGKIPEDVMLRSESAQTQRDHESFQSDTKQSRDQRDNLLSDARPADNVQSEIKPNQGGYVQSQTRDDQGGHLQSENTTDRESQIQRMEISAETGERRVPNFIIFGFSKCGTRAFIEFLSHHPDVASAGPEIDFFNQHYEEGLEWYRMRMPASDTSRVVVEKSSEYAYDFNTPQRIREMNSTIKLMVLVCDPVRRAISEFTQWKENSLQNGKVEHPFEDYAIDVNTNKVLPSNLIQRGCYSVYLKPWLQHFHRRQIFVADGDRFRKNPLPALKKVETFLGLEKYFDESLFTFNANTGFYCPLGKCLGESKERPHPTIDPNILEAVKNYYQPYNDQLFQMIGKSYNW